VIDALVVPSVDHEGITDGSLHMVRAFAVSRAMLLRMLEVLTVVVPGCASAQTSTG
jgi:hypothetical protein